VTIERFLRREIDVGSFPSASWAVGSSRGIDQTGFLGHSVAVPLRIAAAPDTIYDCASITKPLITTTLVLRERALDDSIHGYTVRELLTHTSGLRAWMPLYAYDDPIRAILEEGPECERGTRVIYSDLNFILLWSAIENFDAKAVEHIFAPLGLRDAMLKPPASLKPRIAATEWGQRYERKMIAGLGVIPSERSESRDPHRNMKGFPRLPFGSLRVASNDTPLIRASRTFSQREKDLDEAGSRVRSLAEIPLPPGEGGRRPGEGTVISPSAALSSRSPARDDTLIWGETHDGNSHHIGGGCAGNAGLFATAQDVFRITQAFVNGELLPCEIVEDAIRDQTPGMDDGRGLGWQIGSAATEMLSPGSFGHTGFTGTSVWVDRRRDRIMVLLTNRVHPCAAPIAMQKIRGEFHRLAIS
jgi:CubicO group peptidase (beta-lactamase class C family)